MILLLYWHLMRVNIFRSRLAAGIPASSEERRADLPRQAGRPQREGRGSRLPLRQGHGRQKIDQQGLNDFCNS